MKMGRKREALQALDKKLAIYEKVSLPRKLVDMTWNPSVHISREWLNFFVFIKRN